MDYQILERWLVGLILVSGISGYFLSYLWYFCFCKLIGVEPKYNLLPKLKDGQTGPLTGIIERLLFTILIATDVSGTATAMVGWVVFKNSILWAKLEVPPKDEPKMKYVCIISSVGSILMAILGAQICKW